METGTRGALRAFLCKVRVLGCKRPSLFGLLQAQAEQLQLKSEMSQAPTAAHEWPRNQNGSQRTQVRPWKQQGAGLAGLASGVPHLEALVFETLGPIKEELNPPFFQVRGTKPRKQFRGRLRKLVVESLGSARPRGERAPCLPWLAGIGLGLGLGLGSLA
jgi:hypothetical protein